MHSATRVSRTERQGRPVPSVAGVLTETDARITGEWIATVQRGNGEIPWFSGGHTDPWDHVESAMGLSVAGQWEAAEAAYGFLRDTQRADGSWPLRWQDGVPEDSGTDSNFCAYVAVGVWHHHLVTGRPGFLQSMWSTVRRALDRVMDFRGPQGQMWWSEDTSGRMWTEALVTGSSSIHHALRCGVSIAEALGESVPDWDFAADALADALRTKPELFTPKPAYSMDWYYPILGGVLTGAAADERIESRWDDFVVDGLGIRCVDHRPWVTGAETCELVLALESMGRHEEALEQFTNMQHLRDDGAYWTGLVYTDGKRWPVELSSWTAAAMLLAADALSRTTGGNEIFRYLTA